MVIKVNKLHINKINLSLNLKNIYHIYQINDSHLVYTKDEKELRWYNGKKYFADLFNESYDDYYNHASSVDIFNDIICYINKEDASLVVLNGDIIDYYSKENYKLLKSSLNKIYSDKLFIIGNHEEDSNIYNELSINNDSSFQVIEKDDLVIIGVDNSKRNFTNYQIERLEEVIKKEKDIIVFFHIPIMTSFNKEEYSSFKEGFFIDYEHCDKETHDFISLLLSSNRIKALFTAHTHGTILSYVKEGLPQYDTSSALIGYISEIIIK